MTGQTDAFLPRWVKGLDRPTVTSDLAAGVTVGALLVPQAMAYAQLAGLPPEVGLYSAALPVIVYALFGTSRQLAVGPVAIVSLLTASALAPIAEEGSADDVAAAGLLALLVGLAHLVFGVGRLGGLVSLLSHSVLVGFTAAAAIIIGFSQAKHLLGVSIPRQDSFLETVAEVVRTADETHGTTQLVGLLALAVLFGLKALAPRVPAALVVVLGSIAAVQLFDLDDRGVKVVGDIPDVLVDFGMPSLDGSLVGDLIVTALVITLVGFMESIAVAKVYARRHHYELDPNRELVSLGAANVASGFVGGFPVTGGFSRTAVNDRAGAKSPLASVFAAIVVLIAIALLTPLLSSLPNAALGAIIVAAVVGLIDVAEMRHIARVKRTDLIGLTVAFVATLTLGIEVGIAVAVVASMLVVFARISKPHSAILGHVAGTTSYRNVERFPEAEIEPGIRVLRVDAALSFANATAVKRLLVAGADALVDQPRALVLDASGINDIDATGVEMLDEVLEDLDDRGVALHLTDVKGPVRDVLRRAGLWDRLGPRIHASSHDAVEVITARRGTPADQRASGIDERAAVPGLVD